MTYGAGSNSGDYKKLKGQMIQVTDTDPTVNLGSWATGGNLNTAREFLNSAGTQTASLGFGGRSGSTSYAITERYDGSSWTEVGDLNTGRFGLGGTGTQTAAIGYGGATPPGNTNVDVAETFDGTSWTEVGDLAVATRMGSGGGTTASGFVAGGYPANTPPTETATMEIWADPVYTIKTVTVS